MSGQERTAKEILNKLRKAEVLQAKRMLMDDVLRQPGVSDATTCS